MEAKLRALTENDAWTMVLFPPSQRPIDCKWVDKIKYNSNGMIERYKSQLVAKGFTQGEDNGYIKSFTLVAKLITVHCLLTIVDVRN